MEIKNFVRSNPIAGCNECSKNCSSSVNGHHHALHLQTEQHCQNCRSNLPK